MSSGFQLLSGAEAPKPLHLPHRAPTAVDKSLAILNWQPKSANAVWTRAEWSSISAHLHNGNPSTHFGMGFLDDTGAKKYVRSKRVAVNRAISWGWNSIVGMAKSKIAFVPYSTNERQESRWGGLDFDAHDGNSDRPRHLAFAAFVTLLNLPELSLVLETSGSGGWHVWAISPDFHPIGEWVRLMKSVASQIGVPVASGVCEIYPPDSLPTRFGKGMRAPGSWNPGTDTLSEIVWENTRTSLASVLSGKSKIVPLAYNHLPNDFPDTEKEVSFSSPYRLDDWLQRLGIREIGKRNSNLSTLTGEMFYQVGFAMASHIVEAQFRAKTVSTNATEPSHISSFNGLWRGLNQRWHDALSEAERGKFRQLDTENQRDAFRIIRSFARKARQDGSSDFPIVRDNLGERLGITGKGAAGIREKLVQLGIIAKTANYVANKYSARFKWVL